MPRKSTRKKSTPNLLTTPPEPPPPPPSFEFDFSKFISTPNESKKSNKEKEKTNVAKRDKSSPGDETGKKMSNISELKDMASSKMEFVKRHLDRSHTEILKEFEASESRLHKRLKLQTQGCQQLMDEAEKEYKKMSDRIGEGREAMKDSYSEFITELQASSSRVFKASLPELSQSFGKAIDSLKSHYGIV
ncbi:hypothetical protein LIER_09018 [Lithospermum erythrorhizon]|uniref:Uncharacterized protein n=1 Tax=Lithospermum erythrorhizon TaxID=34254 RepID=A0AAV3PEA7_LITER